MQKIKKFLKKINPIDRSRVNGYIERIMTGDIAGMDIQRLTDVKDTFRVRVGRVRIIFERIEGKVEILEVGWRNDNTYQGL